MEVDLLKLSPVRFEELHPHTLVQFPAWPLSNPRGSLQTSK